MDVPISLNRKLVLEKKLRSSDGAGGYATSWISVGNLWADISAGSGRERTVAGGDLSEVRHMITVRSAPVSSSMRPRPDQRFREGTRVFVIDAVSDFDRFGRFLNCATREEKLS